jgi:hypothetical protein
MAKSLTLSIFRAGLWGALFGLWSSIWVLISAYLTYPHVDAIFGWKVDSFHHLIWGILEYTLIWPFSNLFVAVSVWILFSFLFMVLLAFIGYNLKFIFADTAKKSIAWATKSLLRHYVLLLLYVAISIYLLLRKPTDTLQIYVSLFSGALYIFLPFVFLQPANFLSECSIKVIRSPSWPGTSPFFLYILSLMIGLVIGFFGDAPPVVSWGRMAIALLLMSLVRLISIWSFLTRSGFRRTRKHLSILFSKKVLGGWIALDLYFTGILLFVLIPIITIAILYVFFYPVIVESSKTSGSTIALPWFLVRRIAENGRKIGEFIAIPLEIMFLLSAGRYLWQSDIGGKFDASEFGSYKSSGGAAEK